MENDGVVTAVPRPYTSKISVEEGITVDEDGNSKVVKMIAHTVFHEVGVTVLFYEPDTCNRLIQQLVAAYKEAKSPLTIAKDLPPNGKIT